MELQSLPQPANDKTLRPNERSGYLFSQFLWESSDIPKFERDETGVVNFQLPDEKHNFFIPLRNSTVVYDALILEIRREVKGDFSKDSLKSIAFYELQNDGITKVRFLYNGELYSFPFPLGIIQDDPFALTNDVECNILGILTKMGISTSDQSAELRRSKFTLVKDAKKD